MVTGSRRKRVRNTLDNSFDSEAAKDAFTTRLSAVRSILTPRGRARLDNCDILAVWLRHCPVRWPWRGRWRLIGFFYRQLLEEFRSVFQQIYNFWCHMYCMCMVGVVTERSEPQQLFISEYQTFVDLCNTLGEPCVNGWRWKLGSVVQVLMYRHATSHDPHLTDNFLRKDTFFVWSLCVPSTGCTNKPGAAHRSLVDAFWCTRNVLCLFYSYSCDKYCFVLHRLVHAFTAAGILQSQFCYFATLSNVGTYCKVCPAICDCSHMKLCCPHVYVVYSAKKYIVCCRMCWVIYGQCDGVSRRTSTLWAGRRGMQCVCSVVGWYMNTVGWMSVLTPITRPSHASVAGKCVCLYTAV